MLILKLRIQEFFLVCKLLFLLIQFSAKISVLFPRKTSKVCLVAFFACQQNKKIFLELKKIIDPKRQLRQQFKKKHCRTNFICYKNAQIFEILKNIQFFAKYHTELGKLRRFLFKLKS